MTIAGRKIFVEAFRHFGYPQWFRVVTGSLEVLGGLGLIIGIWVPWLAALASAGLTLVMLGAILTHVRIREPLQKVALPIVMGAGNSGRRELLAHVPAPCRQTINDGCCLD